MDRRESLSGVAADGVIGLTGAAGAAETQAGNRPAERTDNRGFRQWVVYTIVENQKLHNGDMLGVTDEDKAGFVRYAESFYSNTRLFDIVTVRPMDQPTQFVHCLRYKHGQAEDNPWQRLELEVEPVSCMDHPVGPGYDLEEQVVRDLVTLGGKPFDSSRPSPLDLYYRCIKVSNVIHYRTLMGPATCLVINRHDLEEWLAVPGFSLEHDSNPHVHSLRLVGSIVTGDDVGIRIAMKRFTVYSSPAIPRRQVLLVRSPMASHHFGYVLAPYVHRTREPGGPLMSRYGVKVVNEGLWAVLAY